MENISRIAMGLDTSEEEVTEMAAEEKGSSRDKEQQEPEGGSIRAEEDLEREEQSHAVLDCSICLDAVVGGGGERSTARLKCGHEFHLDCIGSAFNSNGIMQCPNCRQIERGQWLYARGPVPSEHVNTDDWVIDEDFYEFDDHPHVFVPFRFRWCPITELPSLLNEIAPSPEAVFHDVMGRNFDAEPIATSEPGTNQQGAYVDYLGSLWPSSSTNIAERTLAAFTYHDHREPLAGPSDGMHRVHPIDFLDHLSAPMPNSYYSPPNNNNGVPQQPGIPVVEMRIGGVDSGSQQQGSLPSYYGNRSAEWQEIPSVPAMAPQLARAHSNVNEQFEQGSSLFPGSLRSGLLGAGGLAMLPQDRTLHGSSYVETTEDVGGNRLLFLERAQLGHRSPMNNEGVLTSSSQQAPNSGSAPTRLFGQWIVSARPPPPPMSPLEENRSPNNV